MYSLSVFVFFLIFVGGVSSISAAEPAPLFPVACEEAGKYGFLFSSGKEAIPCKFDDIWRSGRFGETRVSAPSYFSEGLHPVKVGKLWGYADRSGALVIPAKYQMRPDPFSDGMAKVTLLDPAGASAFINTKGETVFALSREVKVRGGFHSGRIQASERSKKNGAYGYLGKDGKWAISPQYFGMGEWGDFVGDVAAAMVEPQRVDPEAGNAVIPPVYQLISPDGQVLAPKRFHCFGAFREGVAPACPVGSKEYGYVDKQGNFVIPPRFQKAGAFYNGHAFAVMNDHYVLLNRKGDVVFQLGEEYPVKSKRGQFHPLPSFAGGLAGLFRVTEEGGKTTREFVYLNSKGKNPFSRGFLYGGDFTGKIALVQTEGAAIMTSWRGTYIDSTGKPLREAGPLMLMPK